MAWMHVVRQALRYGFFPLALVATPWGVHLLSTAGWHPALATYLPVAALALAYLLAEQLIPCRPQWNRPDGDVANDAVSGTIAYILLPKILGPLYWAALAGATSWLALQAGGSLWPSHWPLPAQLALLLLAGDAGRYWGHRLAHELPLLWRFHAVHHSPKRLYFFNAVRQHPVDKAWFMASELLVPILLGAHGEVWALYFAVTAVCGFAQHTNADLRLGPLYWIFNVVEMHRWHHSRRPEESDHNYGNNLIVYDRLFGTCFHPEARGERGGVGELGLLNPDYPRDWWGQLLAPFRRGQLDKATPAPGSAHAADAAPR